MFERIGAGKMKKLKCVTNIGIMVLLAPIIVIVAVGIDVVESIQDERRKDQLMKRIKS